MTHATDHKHVPSWKIVLAFVLDLITTFFVFGYLISLVFGGTTEAGFELTGGPALLLFALIVAYFVGLGKYGGGTLWQRILGAKR